MAPSERAKRTRREADGGCWDAVTQLGWWNYRGEEGLEQNAVKAGAYTRPLLSSS